MTASHTSRLYTALLLAALVALAPASALAQPPDGSPGPQDPQSDGSGNSTGDEARENRQRPDRSGDNGQGTDRRPADPVEIRETARGFRTESPAGSQRPTVAVDAGQAQASLERPDVHPLSIQVDSVVEYEDTDGDGAYDLGEPVLQRTDLRSATHEVVADPANDTRSVVYHLADGGTLTLRFDLGTNQRPEVATKFDVLVHDYPFSQADSRLALGARVDSPAGLEARTVDGQAGLAGATGEAVPYLSWVQQAQVDGADHEVGWSLHLSVASDGPAQDAILYWSYPQGATIVHDPVLGVTEAFRDLAGNPTPFLVGMAATAGLLGLGYTIRRRTRL